MRPQCEAHIARRLIRAQLIAPVIIVSVAEALNDHAIVLAAIIHGIECKKRKRLFLGAELTRVRRILSQLLGQTRRNLVEVRFCGQRDNPSKIAQRRLIIVARILITERLFSRFESAEGARAIPHEGQRGPKVRACQRAFDPVQFTIMQIAQTAHIGLAGLREHIERIGRGPAHQARFGIVVPLAFPDIGVIAIGPPGIALCHRPHGLKGAVEGSLRHFIAGLAGAVDKVRRIGAKPGRGISVPLAPETERAFGRLAVQHGCDRFLNLRTGRFPRVLIGAHGDKLL